MIFETEGGRKAVAVNFSELDEMLGERKHPIFVALGDLADLLEISEQVAGTLRHLQDCEGGCRQRLGGVPMEALTSCVGQLFQGIFADEGDTGIPPQGMAVPSPSGGRVVGVLYAACAAEELRTILNHAVAILGLCTEIAEAKRDGAAEKVARGAARLLDRYGDRLVAIIERALEPFDRDLDATTFVAMNLTKFIKANDDEPETPEEASRRAKKELENKLHESLEKAIKSMFPGPDDPRVN